MSKKSRFRRPFDKQHDKQSDPLLKSEREHLYHIYWSMWRQFSRKQSVLVTCKILGLCVDTLTVDDKYSLLNSDSYCNIFRCNYPRKKETFSPYFFAFLKCRSNFQHFQKVDDPHSWCICEITDSEIRR